MPWSHSLNSSGNRFEAMASPLAPHRALEVSNFETGNADSSLICSLSLIVGSVPVVKK